MYIRHDFLCTLNWQSVGNATPLAKTSSVTTGGGGGGGGSSGSLAAAAVICFWQHSGN